MGTTVSNLQILGAAESAVKAALPKALVGQWSERFVTACPDDLSFAQLARKAGWLSYLLPVIVLLIGIEILVNPFSATERIIVATFGAATLLYGITDLMYYIRLR